ncbi:rod shape-determining protein MreD [Candidatus Endomicrobiellum trichonymphae]|uniref:Rod shape-determining protein MreD n=1 Tax=Endomicrobium trichonymphae TaxID=1408204 RepID=B1GZB4_ENDTX|nr:rod shape-determining protein MreD [Candidatus Endomicrobium trichonymphae]BAG13596.1 rod shape-determining protein MreD [Candidatus Endomicrobium trichonymphae]
MKKLIFYFFLYFIFCMLQFFFGRYINIYGIFPNFILIFVVYLGLSKGIINTQLMGFLFGLTWDVFSTDIFGIRTVMFTVIGYLAGRFCKDFDREKIFTQIVIMFFAGAIYWLGFGLIYFIFLDNGNCAFSFSILSVSSKILVTATFAPLVFYILEKMDIIWHHDTTER